MGSIIAWLVRRFGLSPNVARYVGYAGLFLALLLLIAAMVSLSQCGKNRQRAAQARLDAAQGEAASNSAADAVGTIQRSGEAQAASEALTRDNERDIRAAQGANDRVNAGVDAAGRAALCRRNAYKDTPQCKKP